MVHVAAVNQEEASTALSKVPKTTTAMVLADGGGSGTASSGSRKRGHEIVCCCIVCKKTSKDWVSCSRWFNQSKSACWVCYIWYSSYNLLSSVTVQSLNLYYIKQWKWSTFLIWLVFLLSSLQPSGLWVGFYIRLCCAFSKEAKAKTMNSNRRLLRPWIV